MSEKIKDIGVEIDGEKCLGIEDLTIKNYLDSLGKPESKVILTFVSNDLTNLLHSKIKIMFGDKLVFEGKVVEVESSVIGGNGFRITIEAKYSFYEK